MKNTNNKGLATMSDLDTVIDRYALVYGKTVIGTSDDLGYIEEWRDEELEEEPDASIAVVDVLDLVHDDHVADRAVSNGAIRSAKVIVEHGKPCLFLDWFGTFNFREVQIREGGGRQEAYRMCWIEEKRVELGRTFEEVEALVSFPEPATAEDLFFRKVDVDYVDGELCAIFNADEE